LFTRHLNVIHRFLGIVAASAKAKLISLGFPFVQHDRTRRHRGLSRRRERALRQQALRLKTALDNMSPGLCMFDGAGRLLVSNESYAILYGLSPDQIRRGMRLEEIVACRAAHGICPVETPDEYLHKHRARITQSGTENRLQELTDGRLLAVSHRPMPDGGWISIHEDVTEKHHNEQRITHMAKHDALTGLPNRVQLREHLEGLTAHARRGAAFALLYLDLDRFKQVNDTYGHPTGDQLLKAVAGRLKHTVREIDMVARLGGDEFAIAQAGIGGQDGAAILARRIIESLTAPFALDGLQISSGTTIGIALSPDDGIDPDDLIKKADLALYRAKSVGRGTWCFFEPELNARTLRRQSIEIGLRKALAEGLIELHYQPIIDHQGSLCCFEALARWHDPERGPISPAEFIPVAEETGLINPLGEAVLRQACAKAASWPDDIKVAVNLSPAQFKGGGLSQLLISALDASGLPARRVELEITETLLMQDREEISRVLHQLRSLGVRIAMDDFGTGYSSLNNLLRFPIDKIKIDRLFIKDIETNANSLAIVRAVVSLGRSLGITVAAEGVETKEQFDLVRQEGCREIQGNFISPPLQGNAADAFLTMRGIARRHAV
jgi:diguanylate cyclase (GGDEF)-like protein